MRPYLSLILRELRRAWSGGGMLMPVAFFLLVAILFPFAVGPDTRLLARIGPGVIWAAALLAALLPVDRLIAPDAESGVLDQLALRGIPDAGTAAAKMAGHWLGFAPPLLAATLVAAALLHVPGAALPNIVFSLAIGTAGLAALAVATGALVAGLRGAGALAGLVMLPFAVPLLIFGAGATAGTPGALKLLAALVLLLLAGGPIVAGAAIRIGRS